MDALSRYLTGEPAPAAGDSTNKATATKAAPGGSEPTVFEVVLAERRKSAAEPGASSAPGNVQSFVAQYKPLADRISKSLGVAPEALLGQWGLETSWGKSVIPGTNNLGNIKDFSGKGAKATDNMTGSVDAYRTYGNADEFGDDFASLLSRRYKSAIGAGKDSQRYFQALKASGYAEDPDYVAKGVAAAKAAAGAMGVAGFGAQPGDFFVGAAAQKPLERSSLEAAKDVALGAGAGVVQGVEMVASAFGADNAVARGANDISQGMIDMQSPARKQQRENRAAAIQEAETSGSTWDEIVANVGAFTDAPFEVTANAVGTSVPTLMMALIPGLGQASVSRLVLQGAMGAAQGAGAVKGSIYEAVERELSKPGPGALSKDDAKKAAAAAQAYDSQNGGDIAIGALIGFAAGTTGIERSLARILSKEGGEAAAAGVAKRAALGVLAEAPTEGLQGGQERLAANRALQNEGIDVPTWQGVAGSAAGEAVASVVPGGVFGALTPSRPELPPELQPVAEKAAEPNSPLSKAAMASNTPEVIAQRQAEQAAQSAPPEAPASANTAARLAELESIGEGRPAQTIKDDQGRDVEIRAEPGRFFTAEEKAEYDDLTARRDATPGAKPKEADTIGERAREIAASVRESGALEMLRSPDSPVKASDLVKDLAMAQSPATPAAAREQALGRVEFALQWAGVDLSARHEATAATPAPQADPVIAAMSNPAVSDVDKVELRNAYNTALNTRLPQATRDQALAQAREIAGRYAAPEAAPTARAQTPAVLGAIEGSPGSMVIEADRMEGGAFELEAEGYPDEAQQLRDQADSLREQAATARAGETGVELEAEDGSSSASPEDQQPVDLPTTKSTPAGEGPAYQRRRRASLQQLAAAGFTTVARTDGNFAMVNPRTGQTFALEGAADSQLARKAIADHITAAAAETNTNPTDGQKSAGNYKKARIDFEGLRIAIENPVGSERKGKDDNGEAWATPMELAHYGYIPSTDAADGDGVDVYLLNTPRLGAQAYVIDQYNEDGSFDETKAVLGASSEAEALRVYDAGFSDGSGPSRRGAVTPMSVADFKAWAKSPAGKKAAGPAPEQAPGAVVDGSMKVKISADESVDIDLVKELPEVESVARGGRATRISKKQGAVIEAIARAFGKDVQFYTGANSTRVGDGFILPSDQSKIYLNATSSMSPLVVFGHELLHQLKRDNPEAHAAIVAVVARHMNRDATKDVYGKLGYSDDQIMEELVSDLGGDLMADSKFWSDVMDEVHANNDSNAARKIIAKLAEFITRAIDAMSRNLRSYADTGAGSALVDDMTEIRAAFQKALAGYMQDQGISKMGMQADVLRAGQEAKRSAARQAEETENFKRWFGDSKVVDADGKPLVVYHATSADFSEFDFSRLGAFTRENTDAHEAIVTAELGAWTNTQMLAEGMGQGKDMPLYMSIQNPLEIRFDDLWAMARDYESGADLRDALERDGYDGLAVDDSEFGGTSYVAFRPNQIKSATGNNGDFSVTDADITRSAARQADLFPKEMATKRTTVATKRLVNSNGDTEKGVNIDSAGNQITPTRQGLENFWRWFGDSQAVADNGRPLAMYHSTNGDIAEFESGRKTTNNFGILGDVETSRAGIFVTPEREFSQEYLREGDGRNVMQVYLKVENPVDLRDGITEALENELEAAGISARWLTNLQNYWEAFDNDENGANDFVSALKAAGYDGAIFNEDGRDGESHVTYVAFDSAQLKSATGNRGTFDSGDANITRSAARQVEETENFKRWFGDSKVVDANGKPLLMYHGTGGDFTAFDPRRIGANAAAEGYGFYFTSDKDTASGYMRQGGGKIFEVYLSIQKPLSVERKGFTKAQLQKIIAAVAQAEIDNNPDEATDLRDTFVSNFADTYSMPFSKAVAEAAAMVAESETAIDQISEIANVAGDKVTTLKAVRDVTGFDGTFADGYGGNAQGGGKIFIAWFPEQIKSATGNNGDFSVTDANITRSAARQVEETENFKRWFGGSKVVDASGNPMVMYHGTPVDFEAFKHSRGDIGLHFGTAEQAADRLEYTRERGGKPADGMQTIPVYLSIKNPLRMRDMGAWVPDSMDYALKEMFPADARRIMSLKTAKQAREFLLEKGYDGIVYANDGEVGGSSPFRERIRLAREAMQKVFPKGKSSFSPDDQKVPEYIAWSEAEAAYRKHREENAEDSYIAFHPTQVKSAIGNNGGYSLKDPSITRSAPRTAIHYSKQPREVLDGRKYGAGMKGAEAARLDRSDDPRIQQRVYAYLNGRAPESNVGGYAHEIDLGNLYDGNTDPLKLWGPRDLNKVESAILDAGFDGYFRGDMAVIMGDASHAVAARPLNGEVIEERTKASLSMREINAIDLANIPGATLRFGTLTVPASSIDQANRELERIGSNMHLADGRATLRMADVVRSLERNNRHGFWPDLLDDAKGKLTLPKKALMVQSTNNKNAARQVDAIDEVLKKHPTPEASDNHWNRMMAYALADKRVPVPPYQLIKRINDGTYGELIGSLSAGQVADADHGFANAAEFRELYTSGQADVVTTGKLALWSFLSRGVSPYVQESLFMDAISGIEPWVELAAAGRFGEAEQRDYAAWADTVVQPGSGRPGAGSKHNLNAFGKSFLGKMSQRGADGRTHLQHLHELIADPNVSGPEVRREFVKFSEGVGIDNKVMSFTLLVSGRDDVMVLDRVQMRGLWDDGRFAGVNLYDGIVGADGKPVTGSSLASLASGARGLLIYEATERAVERNIKGIYEEAGRLESASLGRFHWETWVAYSGQEASHGTIDGLMRETSGSPRPYEGVTAKEGEYGSFAYGTRYGVDSVGTPYFLYENSDGKLYRFDVESYREMLGAMKKASNKVIPTRFLVSKDENGNGRTAPWFEDPRVNREALDRLIAQHGAQQEGERSLPSDGPVTTADGAGSGGVIRSIGRDGGGRRRPAKEALPGAPQVAGATGPDPRLVAVAEAYAQKVGIDFSRQAEYVQVDEARAARIAAAYEAMEHAPQDRKVKAAYADLIRQTQAQYDALVDAGYSFYFANPENDPYAGNPWNAMRDLRANQQMAVFPTDAGFGSNEEFDPANNPLLADTGLVWSYGSPDGQGMRVLANDLFRAVHDAFGHGLEGAGFRAQGEENAWQAHARLFTGPALGAITSETRGQNSWLNYNAVSGEANRTAKVEDTVFADQKTGLMPEWTWTEGRAADMPDDLLGDAPSHYNRRIDALKELIACLGK